MFDPFLNNPLIRRDVRRFLRRWPRSWWFWTVVLALIAHGCLVFWMEPLFGVGPAAMEEDIGVYYFIALHAFLQFCVPLWALFHARRAQTRAFILEYRMAGIPHSHIFWSFWLNIMVPGFVILMAVYIPLLGRFEVFRLTGSNNGILDAGFFQGRIVFHPRAFALFASALVTMLAIPAVRNKWLRLTAWIFATALLVVFPFLVVQDEAFHWLDWSPGVDWDNFMRNSNTGDLANFLLYTQSFPAVILLYAFSAAAWGAGVGVWLGLRARIPLAVSILLTLAATAAAEFGMLNLVFLNDADELYRNPGFILVYWIFANVLPFGAFWMGLKWNLLIALSRRAPKNEYPC